MEQLYKSAIVLGDALTKVEEGKGISKPQAMLHVWHHDQEWFHCLLILGFKCGEMEACEGKVKVVVPKYSPNHIMKKEEQGTSVYELFQRELD